jgi:hypothetical protein
MLLINNHNNQARYSPHSNSHSQSYSRSS